MSGPWPQGPGVVVFPDGCRIRGVGWRRPDRWSHDRTDFSVVLLARPPEPEPCWTYRWLEWRDFALPRDQPAALAALREAHERGRGERVDIGCGAGIGRTGTALALVAVLAGVPVDGAVAWVRRHYHRRAVETPWQRRWIATAAATLA